MPPHAASTTHPPQRTDEPRGLLLIISGPSGAGKTTITRAVERMFPDAHFSISATTRTKTAADRDGVDYRFITDEEFDDLEAKREFIETATYAGNRYGTPRAPVEAALADGRISILEIDVQGAIIVKNEFADALALFILPPSDAELLQRLRDRRREPEGAIQRRYRIAQQEIATAHTCGVYDHFIINDNLDRAIAEAIKHVKERLARSSK